MAGYKITKKDAYYTYEAPGHKECKLCRLHDPQDIDGGRLINGLSHFLPSGGGTEFGDNAMESIYYIVEGTMLFKGDDGVETVLEAGDSVHIAPHSKKCVTNIGTTTAQMLVVLLPEAAKSSYSSLNKTNDRKRTRINEIRVLFLSFVMLSYHMFCVFFFPRQIRITRSGRCPTVHQHPL